MEKKERRRLARFSYTEMKNAPAAEIASAA
jgi:hypothetical protein